MVNAPGNAESVLPTTARARYGSIGGFEPETARQIDRMKAKAGELRTALVDAIAWPIQDGIERMRSFGDIARI